MTDSDATNRDHGSGHRATGPRAQPPNSVRGLGRGDIEAIAERVVELLQAPVDTTGPVRLVDAAEVARRLGVDRGWVYAHAGQLGAIRLGTRTGRLRFDLHTLDRNLHALQPSARPSRLPRAAHGRRRRSTSAPGVDLLPYQPAPGSRR